MLTATAREPGTDFESALGGGLSPQGISTTAVDGSFHMCQSSRLCAVILDLVLHCRNDVDHRVN